MCTMRKQAWKITYKYLCLQTSLGASLGLIHVHAVQILYDFLLIMGHPLDSYNSTAIQPWARNPFAELQ